MKLLEMGVDHSYVMQTMYKDTLESLQKRLELLKRAERLLDGAVACVCINHAKNVETKKSAIEDIHPISGFLGDYGY